MSDFAFTRRCSARRIDPLDPLPGTAELLKELRKFCILWRSLIIAIDGRNGAGKSSLGRYLSWQLDVPPIETDFWIGEDLPVVHMVPELRELICKRLKLDRPVMVEGIMMLRMLEQAKLTSKFLVLITNQSLETDLDDDDHDGSGLPHCLSSEVEVYLKGYRSKIKLISI
jgi:hypothetical protein